MWFQRVPDFLGNKQFFGIQCMSRIQKILGNPIKNGESTPHSKNKNYPSHHYTCFFPFIICRFIMMITFSGQYTHYYSGHDNHWYTTVIPPYFTFIHNRANPFGFVENPSSLDKISLLASSPPSPNYLIVTYLRVFRIIFLFWPNTVEIEKKKN